MESISMASRFFAWRSNWIFRVSLAARANEGGDPLAAWMRMCEHAAAVRDLCRSQVRPL
jgi:hypothetical protein